MSMPSCTIPVTGMTCAACSGRVQRTLERAEGVRSANVNLMTGGATVAYDPAVTSPERLAETIRATGYGAEVPGVEASGESLLDAQDAARADEVRELRGKLVLSAAAGVLAMAVGMLHGLAGDVARYALLGLTLPVVGWAGRHFYVRAWSAFRHHGAPRRHRALGRVLVPPHLGHEHEVRRRRHCPPIAKLPNSLPHRATR